MNSNQDILKVGLAQMAPVWLDRDRALEKVCNYVEDAAGHYSRPDVTQLVVNRERNSIVKFK